MAKILLISTGSIAAVKIPDLVSRLKEQGNEVTCVLTNSAKHFVAEDALSYLSGKKTYTDMWQIDEEDEAKMPHIQLSRENDIILVAPATADFMAKIANGLCDDLASTLCIASDKQIIFAPAMNKEMWAHPATQRNIKTIKSYGYKIIDPQDGKLACGEEGVGKMADITEITGNVSSIPVNDENKTLAKYSFLVTAGPTRENIDPVRYISNYSSGKQGYEIAEELIVRGGKVTLISGPTDLKTPKGINLVKVNSADEMLKAAMNSLPVNAAVCVAAVSDWKPENTKNAKIKKKPEEHSFILNLIENPDILTELSRKGKNRPELVIGFAAETEHVVENAMVKLERKNCDYIIANEVGEGKAFGEDNNEVFIIGKTGALNKIEKTEKSHIAKIIVDLIEEKLRK
ncbi:MAG TPA: bifunctional phosphopantothenoylcysteine decarboxylase/phosphopantothenate--cysteine ligase CoaBC [Alphaproteobacteria bacterium]|nr:bifunctional phosphopantothenoylcysteine decarboxylase/phosphopantothenate--cysteine ligase CoaBC [Alphaproteobacteria bacterium]